MITRREALKRTLVIAGALAAAPATNMIAQSTSSAEGPFKLPPLPYAFDALEPHIDAKTMEIHHGKHHAGYVANLNKAVAEAPELAKMQVGEIIRSLSKVPEKIRTTVRNNAGGHYNHDRFWKMLKPGGGGQPRAELAKVLDKSFGNFSNFQSQFTEAATKVFGSGWAWLVRTPEGRLQIVSTPNQDSPLMTDLQNKPLLGLDVWEHAYYLKYQNRRADYIKAWFNVVNWDYVARRFLDK